MSAKVKLKKLIHKNPVIFFSLLLLAILIGVFVVFQTTYLAQNKTQLDSRASGQTCAECTAACEAESDKLVESGKMRKYCPSFCRPGDNCDVAENPAPPGGGGGGTECDEGCKSPRKCQNGQCIGNPGAGAKIRQYIKKNKCQTDADCPLGKHCFLGTACR